MIVRSSTAFRILTCTIAGISLVVTGCGHKDGGSQQHVAALANASADTTASTLPPSFLRYPGNERAVEPWIQEQIELADAAHVRVLVYVGATWCEPCRRFHEAVQRGELNGVLNGLRFLEFDQDRDASALKVAGYTYQYIPVLALPDPDGRNHGRMITGSIEGPNSVRRDLVPRLQALLAGKVASG